MADNEHLGMGVMISILSGNEESVKAVTEAAGKSIASIKLTEKQLLFGFVDGTKVAIEDDGQSCCESRYMRTDDDIQPFVGAQFLGAEVRDAPHEADDEDHEVQFLVINTSQGSFTIANHNVHNGYYGGFALRARKVD